MVYVCVLLYLHFEIFHLIGQCLHLNVTHHVVLPTEICAYAHVQLMSKSSEKPRLHQIPSEDMDAEDGGGTSPTETTYHSRVRPESLREAEPVTSKSHEEQINLQHALILNQVGKTHRKRKKEANKGLTSFSSNSPQDGILTLLLA